MSPVLVIATGTVTGQVVNSLGQPLAGIPVTAKLNAGFSTPQTISPVGQQVPGEVSAFTDLTGAWSLALVPNNNINPANSTYTIQIQGMPDVYVQLNDTASHVYTSIAVNPTTAILAPVGQTIPGALTVAGLLTAQAELDVSGPAVFHGPNPWVDITHPAYGGKGDGVTDNTAAFGLAVAALPAAGGRILFPPGNFVFASALSFAGKGFIRLEGAGPARTGGTGGASTIIFTGSSGPFVPAAGATIELVDLYFRWPNTFTGTVVDFSNTTFGRIAGCSFIASSGANTATAALIVGLDNVTRALIERSVFHNAQVAIQGIGTSGHFSNSVTIRDCNFGTASTNGDISTAAIQNPGQGWLIQGNTFELGTAAGVLNAIGQNLGGSLAVSVIGNWFGDAGAGVMTMIDINGDGWLVAGNIMGGNANASSILINVESGASGLTVVGNRLQNSGIGVQYTASSRDSFIFGNRYNGVTSFTGGTPISGIIQTSSGSGGPRILGVLQRSFQSPAETVLVSGVDATLGENVSVTLTAARVVGAPLNANTGDRLYFTFTQGGAGAFAVTWNAVFKVTWSDAGNATGKISTIGFWYNGTNWCQIAAQAPYV